MKKITLFFFLLTTIAYTQVQTANFTVSPTTFEENEEITVTVSGVNTTTWGVSDIYLWAWSFDANDENIMDSPTNGSWTNSNEAQKLTNNGNGTYSFTFTPTTLYARTGIGKIGMLVKAKNGTGDKKSQDQVYEVGKFQLTLTTPSVATTIINSGENVTVSASTSLPANFNLKANGVSVDQKTNITKYNFTTPVTVNTNFVLEAVNNGETKSVTFQIIVKPTVTEASLPSNLLDGINFDENDPTKVTLVLYALGKEFIHVIGDFNNWEINNNYLLKKDSSKNRFWIELTGLTPQTNHMYQYIVDAKIRIADPYSAIILDEYNDQFIDNITFPNLPTYPVGKTNHAVTLLRTGDSAYNWQIPNFQAPKKTDLMIYELLLRDFDALHSFDALRARLNYLQELGINAIELMPIHEFDGNLSWGYNPSFHMAMDKYYGSPTAFKQLVDECHQRGIAVILDIAFNHASGQNPFFRLWNNSNGEYSGVASGDNPFFNAVAQHPFNVFNDMNHESAETKNYVKRITQYWIEEYKIDGFRWDLSKGFTQQYTTDVGVWGQYQQARIDILKTYADYQWEADSDFYVILEHFADNSEETQLINHRLNEGKGMMVWGNHHGPYKEAALGSNAGGNSNFSWISYKNRGWSAPQNVSYMVSHDEERLMFENLNYGLSNGGYNTKNLATALDRMKLNGAFYFTIPGPKMIWQFDELGYDISINQNGRTGEKPILWNYYDVPNRKDLYNTWSKLIKLKNKYEIFETTDFSLDVANSNGLKKIHLTNPNADGIKAILILGNFGLTTQSITPFFQETGTWYNLLNDNATITVSNTEAQISLAPGEYRVYGKQPATLSTDDIAIDNNILQLYPNPTSTAFYLSKEALDVKVFDITGKQVKQFAKSVIINNTFSVTDLNTGIYFVRIKENDNKITTKKLIIN